jgi:hypothetical protein
MTGQANSTPDIESTLVAASLEGMEHDDFCILDVLVSWLEIQCLRVNADRLTRLVKVIEPIRTRCFWIAWARGHNRDRRFSRIRRLPTKPIDHLPTGTNFQIGCRGEDPHFQGTPLRVPAGTFRRRPADILNPSQLARKHSVYAARVLMGPSYRADMWGRLQRDPSLSPTQLARMAHGSYSTAWQVKCDFDILSTFVWPQCVLKSG